MSDAFEMMCFSDERDVLQMTESARVCILFYQEYILYRAIIIILRVFPRN